MKTCEHCKTTYDDNAKFCAVCGKELGLPRPNYFDLPDSQPGYVLNNAPKLKSKRKKSLAILLAFFLGFVGAHSFYLGYYKKGIAQILCSLIGISTFWAIIDIFVMIFTDELLDADGKKVS